MKADFVIVGGGIAGLTLADRLSAAGRTCLVLEAGSSGPVGDWRSLSWYDDERDFLEVDSKRVYNTKLLRVKALGGSAEAWEGYVPRWNAADFRQYSRYGIGVDWPLEYEEMEPYYTISERQLGAAGKSGNDKDSYRSQPYPLPSFEWSAYENEVAKRTEGIGMYWHPVPQARNSIPYGRRSHCNGIGECNMCPIQARWTPRATLVPRLLSRSNVRIETGKSCGALTLGVDGNPEAMEVRNRDGSIELVEFGTLVLAAGAIECSRLLLLARRKMGRHDGFWSNPLIGTGYMDHPISRVRATIPWDTGASRQTNILSSSHTHRDYDKSMGSWGFVVNLNRRILPRIWLAAHFEMPSVPHHSISLSERRSDCFGDPVARIRIGTEYDGFEATRLRIKNELDDAARAVGGSNIEHDDLQLWACHPMGGCAISADSKGGVVDRNLKVWGSENVYVLSNGVFCTGASVNPTLTLVSLGHRLANRLLGEQTSG